MLLVPCYHNNHLMICLAANWRACKHWEARGERWVGKKPLNRSITVTNRSLNVTDWRNKYISLHLPSELLTRLKDAIFADNWEIQVFQVVVVGWFQKAHILCSSCGQFLMTQKFHKYNTYISRKHKYHVSAMDSSWAGEVLLQPCCICQRRHNI